MGTMGQWSFPQNGIQSIRSKLLRGVLPRCYCGYFTVEERRKTRCVNILHELSWIIHTQEASVRRAMKRSKIPLVETIKAIN